MRRNSNTEESGVHFICSFGDYDLVVFDNTNRRDAFTKDPTDLVVVCLERGGDFVSVHGLQRFFKYARASDQERGRMSALEKVLHKDLSDEQFFNSPAIFTSHLSDDTSREIHELLPLAAHALKCFGGYVETLDVTE